MPRRVWCGVAAAAVWLCGSVAWAQTTDIDYTRSGPYMSLGFSYAKESFGVDGVEKQYSADLDYPAINAPSNPCPAAACEAHVLIDRTDSLGFDLRGGYRITPMFAAEFNFQYFDKYKLKLGGKAADFADINTIDAFINGKLFPFGNTFAGVLQPYLLAGIGGVFANESTEPLTISRTFVLSNPGANNTVTSSISSMRGSDSRALFAGRMGGGLDYYITRNIVLEFDISYTLTTNFNVQGFKFDTNQTPTNVNRNITLNHVPITLALQYRL